MGKVGSLVAPSRDGGRAIINTTKCDLTALQLYRIFLKACICSRLGFSGQSLRRNFLLQSSSASEIHHIFKRGDDRKACLHYAYRSG